MSSARHVLRHMIADKIIGSNPKFFCYNTKIVLTYLTL